MHRYAMRLTPRPPPGLGGLGLFARIRNQELLGARVDGRAACSGFLKWKSSRIQLGPKLGHKIAAGSGPSRAGPGAAQHAAHLAPQNRPRKRYTSGFPFLHRAGSSRSLGCGVC